MGTWWIAPRTTGNISQLLSSSKGKAISTNDGWKLTSKGKKRVVEICGPAGAREAAHVSPALRNLLPKIKNLHSKDFLEESIACYEHELYRAAVVLSWVGAVSLLQDHVVSECLAEFNAEALRRDAKWKKAKNSGDLVRLKEKEFLDIIDQLSIIDKNVKQELSKCLTLRNSCGHPNKLDIKQLTAANHLEILTLNVFAIFS